MCDAKCCNVLYPTTSSLSKRYDSQRSASPDAFVISPGFCSYGGESRPQYLPPGWSAYIQPEGKMYFARESVPKVVTEAYMYSTEVQDKISCYITEFHRRLAEHDITLPDAAELFLELDTEDESCLYYLVDYDQKVEFWIEETSDDLLSLPFVVSDSHLRLVLEEHFWTHVEHFPAHRCMDVPLNADMLYDTFLQGRGDQLTSATSTFPYNAEECGHFISLLSSAKSSPANKHTIALIARLWVVIFHYRFNVHYGQEHARLSCDQSILDSPVIEKSSTFNALSRLLFGFPTAYLERLESVYLDELVYEKPWRSFIISCQREWSLSAAVALALLVVNLVTLIVPGASSTLVGLSMLLSNGALLGSAILLIKHQSSATFSASDAACFLSDVRGEHVGFQRAAMMFSAPKALICWALGVYSLNTLLWLVFRCPLLFAIIASGLVLVSFVIAVKKLALATMRLAGATGRFIKLRVPGRRVVGGETSMV